MDVIMRKNMSSGTTATSNDLEASNPIGTVFDYLTIHQNEIRQEAVALKSFESHICAVLAETNSQPLKEVLMGHGWTQKGNFDDSLILDDCLQALGNAYIAQFNNPYLADKTTEEEKIRLFVPNILVGSIGTDMTNVTELKPADTVCTGMIVDIVGFSSMVELLSRQGAKGLDELHTTMKSFLFRVSKTILHHGGDVVLFEGVSLVCVFKDVQPVHDNDAAIPITPVPACVRAIQCGLEIRDLTNGSLGTKVAINYGEIKFSIVGGRDGNWNYVLHGNCLLDLHNSVESVGDGELIISNLALEILTDYYYLALSDSPRKGESTYLGSLKLLYLQSNRIKLLGSQTFYKAPTRKLPQHRQHHDAVCEAVASTIRLFIPAPVLAAICLGNMDSMSELRCVTTLSVTLLQCGTITEEFLPSIFRSIQEAVLNSGGYLKRFVQRVDGWMAVIMWGLPLSSYASNCARSLYCAMSIQNFAKSISWTCSIGITTGSAFSGLLGCSERKDYMIIGQSVIRSEELMHLANGVMLVDETTHKHLSHNARLGFVQIPSQVDIFQYQNNLALDPQMMHEFRDEFSKKTVVLRQKIRETISLQLDKLSNRLTAVHLSVKLASGDSTRSMGSFSSRLSMGDISCSPYEARANKIGTVFTVILGSAGTGKSTAVKYAIQNARRRNLNCVYVQCSPGEEANPFGLVSRLFLEIVGSSNFLDEQQQRLVVHNILDAVVDPSREDYDDIYLKLFNSIKSLLGLRWGLQSDNAGGVSTKGFDVDLSNAAASLANVDNHNDKTFTLMLSVLLKNKRTVIVVDDAHYCDELSWHQLHQVLLNTKLSLAIFMTSRAQYQGVKIKYREEDEDYDEINDSLEYNTGSSLSLGLTSSMASLNCVREEETEGIFGSHGYERVQNPSYLAIVSHPHCCVIELEALDEDAVCEILQQELGIGAIEPKLIASVHGFTGGIAFWCNAVAQYIKIHGIDSYFNDVVKMGSQQHNALNALVLSRFDQLTADQQKAAKMACVLGEQFTAEALKSVLVGTTEALASILAILCHENFITCIDSSTDLYSFQNTLIRTTLYDTIPPSVVMDWHFSAAQFMELKGSTNFPMLSYHYRHSSSCRYAALKYTVKSAVRSIRHGAYSEGFAFLQTALPLAITRPELKALLTITNQAMKLINPSTSAFAGLLRRISFMDSSSRTEQAQLFARYSQFSDDIESTIKYMSNKPDTNNRVAPLQSDLENDLSCKELEQTLDATKSKSKKSDGFRRRKAPGGAAGVSADNKNTSAAPKGPKGLPQYSTDGKRVIAPVVRQRSYYLRPIPSLSSSTSSAVGASTSSNAGGRASNANGSPFLRIFRFSDSHRRSSCGCIVS